MRHTLRHGSTATPLAAASKHDPRRTEPAGTTAICPAAPLVRDEEAQSQSLGEPGYDAAPQGWRAAKDGEGPGFRSSSCLFCKPICKPDAARQHETGRQSTPSRIVRSIQAEVEAPTSAA
jgi:hypothetical protein